jgi:hypothetical protein
MFSIVWTIGNVRMLAPPFRPAWAALDIPSEIVGPPHQWICDTPEYTSFGPDEGVVFPVGADQLVLNWRDHMILLPRRVDAPSAARALHVGTRVIYPIQLNA